jgi:hypothetical protein
MNVKDKQRVVIQFLLSEGCVGEEIQIRHGSCTAQLRNVALLSSDESAKFAAPMKNSETKDALEDRINMKLMQQFGQFSKKTRCSLRTLPKTLSISPETIRRHMSQMRDTLRTLPWTPHALACALKQVHFTLSWQLLSKLRSTCTMIGGISSRGTKADFTISMFKIEYGPHGMKARLKSKT